MWMKFGIVCFYQNVLDEFVLSAWLSVTRILHTVSLTLTLNDISQTPIVKSVYGTKYRWH
jgi:hypothetical protein